MSTYTILSVKADDPSESPEFQTAHVEIEIQPDDGKPETVGLCGMDITDAGTLEDSIVAFLRLKGLVEAAPEPVPVAVAVPEDVLASIGKPVEVRAAAEAFAVRAEAKAARLAAAAAEAERVAADAARAQAEADAANEAAILGEAAPVKA